MRTRERLLAWVVNGLTILIAVLALMLLIKQYLTRPVNASLPQGPPIGGRVNLPNVNWTANSSTLLFAMQSGCHWCEASASFYRDLIRANAKGNVHLIAVLPQPIEEDKHFLGSLSLDFQDVRQSELGVIDVYATPTLLLVGRDGTVKKVWTGMLSPDREADVFRNLGLVRLAATVDNDTSDAAARHDSIEQRVPNLMSAIQMVRLRRRKKSLTVLDVRPLPEFQKGHIAGALNIPQDEFEERVPHEIPKGVTVVVYCHYCPPCESEKEAERVMTYCKVSEQLLAKLGYRDVEMLSDDLDHLKRAGVETTGSSAEPFVGGSTPVVE